MKSYHSRVWGEIEFYSRINQGKLLLIEGHENYQKRSSRNRYVIATTNGLLTLSIPLKKGKNSQTSIQEVQISYDDNWVAKHLTAIKSAYGKAAYFEHYYPYVEAHYLKSYSSLYQFNLQSIKLINKLLRLEVAIHETTEYQGTVESSLTDYIPKKYQQVFEFKHGFRPNCSIIDLLFCMGPESILYL